jgi:tetratricopeptide (TPR) repeat protein
MDIGLRFEPDYVDLIGERGAALMLLHRPAEMLANDKTGLDGLDAELKPKSTARLWRGQGYALTELKRYDEAVAAYMASLKLDPGNPLALSEINYIRGLQAGGQAAPGETITQDKVAKRQFQQWPATPAPPKP